MLNIMSTCCSNIFNHIILTLLCICCVMTTMATTIICQHFYDNNYDNNNVMYSSCICRVNNESRGGSSIVHMTIHAMRASRTAIVRVGILCDSWELYGWELSVIVESCTGGRVQRGELSVVWVIRGGNCLKCMRVLQRGELSEVRIVWSGSYPRWKLSGGCSSDESFPGWILLICTLLLGT